MSLTKSDIVGKISDELGMTRQKCVTLVESLFEILRDELSQGNPVKISGFGKWTVREKKERRGRNPKTGEATAISARKVVTFKPSAVLKDELNVNVDKSPEAR